MDRAGVCTLSTGPGLVDLGLAPGEVVGKNLFERYADAEPQEHLRRVLAGEEFTVERQHRGRVRSIYFQPVRYDGGAVTGARPCAGRPWALGARTLLRDVIVGAVLSVSSWYFFAVGLDVPLPPGILDGIL